MLGVEVHPTLTSVAGTHRTRLYPNAPCPFSSRAHSPNDTKRTRSPAGPTSAIPMWRNGVWSSGTLRMYGKVVEKATAAPSGRHISSPIQQSHSGRNSRICSRSARPERRSWTTSSTVLGVEIS